MVGKIYLGSSLIYDATAATDAPDFTGGTVTELGGFRQHVFTTLGVGSLVMVSPGTVELLVVGGGGGGANSNNSGLGGGGAGGVVHIPAMYVAATTALFVGAGGAGVAIGGEPICGQGSRFGDVYAAGGGSAGGEGTGRGQPGGSGGGGGALVLGGGVGIPGQGHDGGTAVSTAGGGGGGAGAAGANGSGTAGGAGGVGVDLSSVFGTSVGDSGWFGGGGSGRGTGSTPANPLGRAANSGGGGISTYGGTSGAGYDGVVIVRYAI